MRYSQIVPFEVCNGEGIGTSLFVQGCDFYCEGCFNSSAWDFNGGYIWNEDVKQLFFTFIDKPHIKRISILGGEPLHNKNVKAVYDLCKELKNKYKDKQIWVYTGYTFENIITNHESDEEDIYRRNILYLADIIVDGRFEQNKKDLTLAFRGSSNQRIIDTHETVKQGKIILY